MKTFLFTVINLIMATAHGAEGAGYCYDKAVKYKDLMHTQVIADLDLEGGVNAGPENLDYSAVRYSMDSLQEIYLFSIPTGNAEDGFTNLVYVVIIEAWLNTGDEAFICDVIKFNHEKTF